MVRFKNSALNTSTKKRSTAMNIGTTNVTDGKSQLNQLFGNPAEKLTENGDKAYSTLDNALIDLFAMSVKFNEDIRKDNTLDLPFIGRTPMAKLLAMFLRDPRFGSGYKKLGRYYAIQADLSYDQIVKSGSYKDIVEIFLKNDKFQELSKYFRTQTNVNGIKAVDVRRDPKYIRLVSQWKNDGSVKNALTYLFSKMSEDNLCKKWMPGFHLSGKSNKRTYGDSFILAALICDSMGIRKSDYQKLKKTSTIESLLSAANKSNGLLQTIDFAKLPSKAATKYRGRFLKNDYPSDQDWRDVSPLFKEFQARVAKAIETGTVDKSTHINVGTHNIIDIYKKMLTDRDKSTGLVTDNTVNQYMAEKSVYGSWVPVIDTSGSMISKISAGINIIDVGMALGYYFAKTSTYAKDYVVSFSSRPQMIKLGQPTKASDWSYGNPVKNCMHSQFAKDINSMYTGDCSNTDFGAVMDIFKKMNPDSAPDWLIVISDMEFDCGSSSRKDDVMRDFMRRGVKTRIVWWNVNNRSTTSTENLSTADKYGNVFFSGYSPNIVDALVSGKFNVTMAERLQDTLMKYAEKAGININDL